MKRLSRLAPAALALVLVFSLAAQSHAQVLKQVPSNAMVVIKFNNLTQTSQRMGALATKFGIANMNPAAGDPLGSFKKAIGANAGINDAGEAAVVILPHTPEQGQNTKKPNTIVLLPVSSYKEFLGNYADAKTEGDVSELKLPSQPNENAYAVNWGDYVAISEFKDTVATKPQLGIEPTGLAAKELAAKDITIFANMKAVRDRCLPELQKRRGDLKAKMETEIKKNPQANEKTQALASSMFDKAMDVAEQFLKQSSAATYGVSLSEDTIRSTGLLEFDPASDWGKSIAQIKNSNEPLVVGLPDMKYLFVCGLSVDSESATKFLDTVAGPIEAELTKMGDDGKPFLNYIAAFKAMLKAEKSGAGGWVAPTGTLGQDAIFQFVSSMKGDANALINAQRDMFNTQQAMMDAMGTKAQVQTSYTANAKTVDGIQLNQFSTKFTPPGQNATPQEMQMQQMMTWMYGPNGMNGYSGAVGNDKAIVAMGVSDEVISKLIAAAKADDAALAKRDPMTQVSNQLPKSRIFVGYVPLDNLATTIVSYLKQFGMPVNIQLPENLQPVGFSAGTEASAVRVDSVVPAQTVQSLVAAALQAYMNMQQGQGGAGGAQPGAGGGGGL